MTDPREPKQAKGVFIKTYGCQMNVYDSERMRDVLRPLGYAPVDSAEQADLVVLNTCHIREKATEKVYSELGQLKLLKQVATLRCKLQQCDHLLWTKTESMLLSFRKKSKSEKSRQEKMESLKQCWKRLQWVN